MALTTYTELKSAVADWLARSDLTTQIPDLITLAEAGFQRDIRHRLMATTTTLSTSASTPLVATPADFLEATAMILQSTPNRLVNYVSPSQLATDYPDASAKAKPTEYTIIGTNFKYGAPPDAVYSVELQYYQKIPVLSGSNATNWLLTAYPDAYLYGTLLQAAPFIQNDKRIPVWASFFTRILEGIGIEGQRSQWSSGPMSAKVDISVG